MKFLLLASSCLLLASSCAVLQPAPEKKVAKFIAQHPELVRPETVTVEVPHYLPQVFFRKQFVPVHDTVWIQRETRQLDSLILNLETSLDSVQRAATKAKIHQLVVNRPVLRDTLCFDTLGVSGRIWLKGRTYGLEITRAAVRDTTTAAVVVGTIKPCPDVPHYGFFDPRGWAWWLLLLIGFLTGASITWGLFSLTLRAAR